MGGGQAIADYPQEGQSGVDKGGWTCAGSERQGPPSAVAREVTLYDAPSLDPVLRKKDGLLYTMYRRGVCRIYATHTDGEIVATVGSIFLLGIGVGKV